MDQKGDQESRLSRLLHVRRDLKRALSSFNASDGESSKPEAGCGGEQAETGRACLICGYDLSGQTVDRCPECGLKLALSYRDPAAWGAVQPDIVGWLVTAIATWKWDRRMRNRSAMVPVTGETKRFARWSTIAASILFGLALGLANTAPTPHSLVVFLFFFLTFIIGSAGVYALLSLMTFWGCIAFSGQWRRFKFAPASIHYATAWWLPLSLVLLFVAIVHRILPSAITSISASVILLAGIVVWSLWLWAGISDTQRVRAPTVRVLGYLIICMLSVGAAVSVLPGFVPRVVVSLTKRLTAGLSPVVTMKITGARTYVLMIDAINHQETPLVIETVKQMGASDEDIVTLIGDKCTLQAIDEEFSDARLTLTEKDKFILYIKGHGSKYGSGSVRVAYGELSSQRVGDFLSRLPTPNTLVVIDSCYGGKFITALSGRVDAVMVTSSDNLNLAYSSTLEEFWKALNNPSFDWDGDKRVSGNEAFWGVYRSMAKQGEKIRARWLKKTEIPTTKEMVDYRKKIEEFGFATPQLAELGEPRGTDFAVQLPGPEVPTAVNATTNGVDS